MRTNMLLVFFALLAVNQIESSAEMRALFPRLVGLERKFCDKFCYDENRARFLGKNLLCALKCWPSESSPEPIETVTQPNLQPIHIGNYQPSYIFHPPSHVNKPRETPATSQAVATSATELPNSFVTDEPVNPPSVSQSQPAAATSPTSPAKAPESSGTNKPENPSPVTQSQSSTASISTSTANTTSLPVVNRANMLNGIPKTSDQNNS